MKIAVIGGGPIGCYTAHLLAKQGHSVSLYEKKQKIGLPLQCTGLVTQSFSQIIKLQKKFIANTTQHIKLISPSNKQAIINQKEYVLDRTLFDQYLANLAHDSGVKINLNHHLAKKEKNNLILKNKNKTIKTKPDIVIGADGPLSQTAQIFNFPNQNCFYYGFQARIRGDFQSDTYHVNFNQKNAPNFFSWLVPETNKIARIGLATASPNKVYFKKLIQKYQTKVIDLQAGLIPIYNPKIKTQLKNTFLIGDAATQVKATTGGGLIPGLKAAQVLSQAIDQNTPYPKLWKKTIGKKLWLHLQIRKIFNKFTNSDWDRFISLINQKNVKNILEQHDREHPFKLLKILPTEPKFLVFLKHLL